MKAEPGRVTVGFKTSPQHVSFATLDETWAAAAELPIFTAAWMNDHVSDPAADAGGPSFEALTIMAALAHRVPGVWMGHSVLANTFRHPPCWPRSRRRWTTSPGAGSSWGSGWAGTPGSTRRSGSRCRRSGSASSGSPRRSPSSARSGRPGAATAPGVTLDDPFVPLRGATNEPSPLTPGGPPIFLGGQGPKGLRLAAEQGDGWFVPSMPFVDPVTFAERRGIILAAMEAAGRDPAGFQFVAQVGAGGDAATRAEARAQAIAFTGAGATHISVAIPARLGPDALVAAAREVAEPVATALA